MSYVEFKRGSKNEYNLLETKSIDTFYHCEDTGELFLGETLINVTPNEFLKLVTINELIDLKLNNNLIPGCKYLITDYKTFVSGNNLSVEYKETEINYILLEAINSYDLKESATCIQRFSDISPNANYELIAYKCDYDYDNEMYTEDGEYYKYAGNTITIDSQTYYIWNKYEVSKAADCIVPVCDATKGIMLTKSLDFGDISIDNPYTIQYFLRNDDIITDYVKEPNGEKNNDAISRVVKIDKPIYNYHIKYSCYDFIENENKYGLDNTTFYMYNGDTLTINDKIFFIWYKYCTETGNTEPIYAIITDTLCPHKFQAPYAIINNDDSIDTDYFTKKLDDIDVFGEVIEGDLPIINEKLYQYDIKFSINRLSDYNTAIMYMLNNGGDYFTDYFELAGTIDIDSNKYYLWKSLGGILGNYDKITDKLIYYGDNNIKFGYGNNDDFYFRDENTDHGIGIDEHIQAISLFDNDKYGYICIDNAWYKKANIEEREKLYNIIVDNQIEDPEDIKSKLKNFTEDFWIKTDKVAGTPPYNEYYSDYYNETPGELDTMWFFNSPENRFTSYAPTSFAELDYNFFAYSDIESLSRTNELTGVYKIIDNTIENVYSDYDISDCKTFGNVIDLNFISHMKDNLNNEADYDFKHIKINGNYTFGTQDIDYTTDSKYGVHNNKLLSNGVINKVIFTECNTHSNIINPSVKNCKVNFEVSESYISKSESGLHVFNPKEFITPIIVENL